MKTKLDSIPVDKSMWRDDRHPAVQEERPLLSSAPFTVSAVGTAAIPIFQDPLRAIPLSKTGAVEVDGVNQGGVAGVAAEGASDLHTMCGDTTLLLNGQSHDNKTTYSNVFPVISVDGSNKFEDVPLSNNGGNEPNMYGFGYLGEADDCIRNKINKHVQYLITEQYEHLRQVVRLDLLPFQ